MSETLRLFIALSLPEDIRQTLEDYQQSLKADLGPGLRWSRPEQFHITLYFLGDVAPRYVSRIEQDMQFIGRKHQTFSLTTAGLGSFPSRQRPSVIWLGFETAAPLQQLQRHLGKQLRDLSEAKTGAFIPHITLGRLAHFRAGQALREALDRLEPPPLMRWQVTGLELYLSQRQRGRVEHSRLHQVALSQT